MRSARTFISRFISVPGHTNVWCEGQEIHDMSEQGCATMATMRCKRQVEVLPETCSGDFASTYTQIIVHTSRTEALSSC